MVEGKWNITIETPKGERSGVFDLKAEGTTLTGSMSHGSQRVEIGDGKIEGNTLHWTAKITAPMSMKLKFTATVDGDRISGVAKHLLGKAAFSGTRAG